MHLALIINPVARRARLAEAQVCGAAVSAGFSRITVARTTPERPGGPQARAALDDGADLVVVAGGDGTVREVARAMADSSEPDIPESPRVPLGIVPTGTANLFARNLGMLPHRIALNASSAVAGVDRRVDVGVARMEFTGDPAGAPGEVSEQAFLTVAGVGHDAASVLATKAQLKRRFGWLAYFEAGARHLGRRPLPMTITVDGDEPQRCEVWSYLVGNAPRIPGRIEVFPQVKLDDGDFATLAVMVRRVRDWAPVGAKGLLHLRRDVPGLVYGSARSVAIAPQDPTAVQLDGDPYAGVARLEISIRPGALTVRC